MHCIQLPVFMSTHPLLLGARPRPAPATCACGARLVSCAARVGLLLQAGCLPLLPPRSSDECRQLDAMHRAVALPWLLATCAHG